MANIAVIILLMISVVISAFLGIIGRSKRNTFLILVIILAVIAGVVRIIEERNQSISDAATQRELQQFRKENETLIDQIKSIRFGFNIWTGEIGDDILQSRKFLKHLVEFSSQSNDITIICSGVISFGKYISIPKVKNVLKNLFLIGDVEVLLNDGGEIYRTLASNGIVELSNVEPIPERNEGTIIYDWRARGRILHHARGYENHTFRFSLKSYGMPLLNKDGIPYIFSPNKESEDIQILQLDRNPDYVRNNEIYRLNFELSVITPRLSKSGDAK